jgi:hypothetical protein
MISWKLGIIVLSVLLIVGFGASSYVAFSANMSPVNTAAPIPTDVWSHAPYPNYEYFAQYSTTNGSISSITVMSYSTVVYALSGCGVAASQYDNMSKATSCIFGNMPFGVSALNVTGYTGLSTLSAHLGAFQVNLKTLQIEPKPGWMSCTNPNYGNGTNPCN